MGKFNLGEFARTLSTAVPSAPAEAVPRTIEAVTGEILEAKRTGGEAILTIGRCLMEAKGLLSHGEWLPWLNEQVELSERAAQRFMRLAREWSNPTALSDLGATKALTLLALPPEEREQFIAEVHEVGGEEKSVIDMSARELEQAIRERDEARKAAEAAQAEARNAEEARAKMEADMAVVNVSLAAVNAERDQADQEIARLERELTELKNRPVEVAVEKVIDQDAIEAARREAVAGMQAKLDKAREAERKRALSDRYKAETQGYAKRLLRAIEAAGVPDDTSFPWDYYRSYDVATVRAYAAGQFPEGSVWSSAYLSPDRCHDPAATAKILQCSTDYLLGVSDDLGNAPAQQEERRQTEASPPEAGPAPAPVPISPAASGSMAGNGWYPGSVTPKEGQRAVVEENDGDFCLGIFRRGTWLDFALDVCDIVHELEAVAAWLPWNPRGEEDPAPVWRTDPPERSRPVYARFDAEGTEIRSVAWYDHALQQYFFKRGGASIDAGCVGWVPLPEEET